jgi:integrase
MFEKLPEQYKDLVIVALNTGLRKTEQLSLKWTDVDFRLEQIIVRQSKSGESRVIPINQAASECFKRLSKVRLLNNPYVFPGENPGERQKDLPKFWERYLEQAGIEDFHWHDLRHTFASRLVMAEVDLYTVSKLLGHADIQMTQRYAHLTPGHMKQAVARLAKPVATATETATA